VKRRDLMRHLMNHGCVVIRDEGSHTVVRNTTHAAQSSVPDIAKSRIQLHAESASNSIYHRRQRNDLQPVVSWLSTANSFAPLLHNLH